MPDLPQPLMIMAMCTALAGCMAEGPLSTASPGVTASDVPTDFRRSTLIVEDIDRALLLYRDVLGFEINYDTVVETSGVALPAGEPGAKARLVLMNGKDAWIGWIGFMQWLDPAIAPPPVPKTRLGIGDHVMIFNTDDAEARCAAAAAMPGIRSTAPARLQTYPGRGDAPDIRVMGCNFFDFDGNLIELNQILKD